MIPANGRANGCHGESAPPLHLEELHASFFPSRRTLPLAAIGIAFAACLVESQPSHAQGALGSGQAAVGILNPPSDSDYTPYDTAQVSTVTIKVRYLLSLSGYTPNSTYNVAYTWKFTLDGNTTVFERFPNEPPGSPVVYGPIYMNADGAYENDATWQTNTSLNWGRHTLSATHEFSSAASSASPTDYSNFSVGPRTAPIQESDEPPVIGGD